MKFPRQIRSSVLRCCAAICLTAASVCAQSQPPQALLELKTCGRALQVFVDGTVVESRDGKQTKTRLSKSRMHKLRQIISSAPCRMWYEIEIPSPAHSTRKRPKVTPNLNLGGDCSVPVILSGTTPEALRDLEVTRRYGGYEGRITLFIPCERPTAAQKQWLKRNSQEYIKPKWRRFLSEVARALGGNNILNGCKCSEE